MSEITIVTHSSRFHADDVFAVATLKIWCEKQGITPRIVRTRDEEDVVAADIVVDVGGEYNPETKRFDHHQKEGAGERENGIPYAAFGLVWKHYGPELVGSEDGADIIDQKIASPLDAMDNGVDICDARFDKVYPYSFATIVSAFTPTWQEDDTPGAFDYDEMFEKVTNMARTILEREIIKARGLVEGMPKVEELYQQAEDKRVIVMENNYPYALVLDKYPEPLFVVRSNTQDDTWSVAAIQKDLMVYGNRKDLPRAWAGLRDEDLARVTGVEDAVFCHRKLFLAVAKSKEGALKLARLAVEA